VQSNGSGNAIKIAKVIRKKLYVVPQKRTTKSQLSSLHVGRRQRPKVNLTMADIDSRTKPPDAMDAQSLERMMPDKDLYGVEENLSTKDRYVSEQTVDSLRTAASLTATAFVRTSCSHVVPGTMGRSAHGL
jgi:hypothetical protein